MSLKYISLPLKNKSITVVGDGINAQNMVRYLSAGEAKVKHVADIINFDIESCMVIACYDSKAQNKALIQNISAMGKMGFAFEEMEKAVNDFIDQEKSYQKGKVFLVGFGPGNTELLTVKALKLLRKADVILYDDLLDASILDEFNAEKVYVGKRRDNHSKEQDEINNLLAEYAERNKMVVRLKGGDPFIFGRGSEEQFFLEERGIATEVIPGITSAIAAAALSSIPLTHRGIASSVSFGTAHGKSSFVIPNTDTSVYYMGAKNIKDIAQEYLNKGYTEDFPVGVVYKVSHPEQNVIKTTLKEIIEGKYEFKSPLISIFGHTVNYQKILSSKS